MLDMEEHGEQAGPGPSSGGGSEGGRRKSSLRIGCALLPKKVARYLTPAMKHAAAARGIELCLIDYARPLSEQGSFDGIIHKLRPNKEWERDLLEYSKQHPEVTVIDRVDGIRTLQNRSTMLSPLHGDGILVKPNGWASAAGQCAVRVQAPVQVEILETTTLAEAEQMLRDAGLKPPLLVKPLWSDGREGSHGLAVLHDLQSMGKLLQGAISSDLKPPLVVQQFVEHGGVLYKVYVLGRRTVVSQRPSLGDHYLGSEARRKGVLQLPRISCKSVYGSPAASGLLAPPGGFPGGAGHRHPGDLASASAPLPSRLGAGAEDGNVEGSSGGAGAGQLPAASAAGGPGNASNGSSSGGGGPGVGVGVGVEVDDCSGVPGSPPDWVTHSLAGVLRKRLGLQLFNFDLICPEEQSSPHERLFYVIDINYFPGVDKIPDFEAVFVDFLRAACTGEPQSRSMTGLCGSCGGSGASSPECGRSPRTSQGGGQQQQQQQDRGSS